MLPVPWDLTTSYHRGTSKGPEAILQASTQLDLYYPPAPALWQHAPFMLPINAHWLEQNQAWSGQAQRIIHSIEQHGQLTEALEQQLEQINAIHQQLTAWIHKQTQDLLEQNKIPGLVGGEHSVSLGLLQSLAQNYSAFGILHIDAHLDLRKAYMGFNQSHASIMYNALALPQITKLVSVAVRDYCVDEINLVEQQSPRIELFTDIDLHQRLYQGQNWNTICTEIIAALPQHVYLSFDIDGLSPAYCPDTGTPVPGGISYNQAVYLIRKLAVSGKQLIGFDLVEVAPGQQHDDKTNDYDANVGARILWELTGCAYLSTKIN